MWDTLEEAMDGSEQMQYKVVKDTELPHSWLVVDGDGNEVFWRDGVRAKWECLDHAGWLNWRK